MPCWITADSEPRWPGPVIFALRMGSFGSI
jgi:hypothetical protein